MKENNHEDLKNSDGAEADIEDEELSKTLRKRKNTITGKEKGTLPIIGKRRRKSADKVISINIELIETSQGEIYEANTKYLKETSNCDQDEEEKVFMSSDREVSEFDSSADSGDVVKLGKL